MAKSKSYFFLLISLCNGLIVFSTEFKPGKLAPIPEQREKEDAAADDDDDDQSPYTGYVAWSENEPGVYSLEFFPPILMNRIQQRPSPESANDEDWKVLSKKIQLPGPDEDPEFVVNYTSPTMKVRRTRKRTATGKKVEDIQKSLNLPADAVIWQEDKEGNYSLTFNPVVNIQTIEMDLRYPDAILQDQFGSNYAEYIRAIQNVQQKLSLPVSSNVSSSRLLSPVQSHKNSLHHPDSLSANATSKIAPSYENLIKSGSLTAEVMNRLSQSKSRSSKTSDQITSKEDLLPPSRPSSQVFKNDKTSPK